MWLKAIGEAVRRGDPRVVLGAFLVVVETALAVWAFGREPWHDEGHFVETVMLFGRSLTIETIAHYREMSTPLPFVLYGLWGRIVGFGLPALRTLSVLLALATYMLCERFFRRILGRPWLAAALTGFIAVNPYMAGASVLVFTEMVTMFFVVLVLIAVAEDRPVLLGLSLASAVLCRQYTVFLTAAAGVVYARRFVEGRRRRDAVALASIVLSCLPMVGLMVLWNGPAPDSDYRELFLGGPVRYDFAGLSVYVIQLFLYLSPAALYMWRRHFANRKTWLWAALVSQVYWLMPVEASACSIRLINRDTVGYAHRLIRAVVGSAGEQAVFYGCFLCGLPLLFGIVSDAWKQSRFVQPGIRFMLPVAVIAFLVIQPWSYMTWEKYFLPVLPIAGAWVVLGQESGDAGSLRA